MIIMSTVNILNNLLVQPADCQIYIAVINIPFVFVFFYGLLTESVAICNSRKKVYIIMMAVIQIACLTSLALIPISEENIKILVPLITVNSFAMAVQDTIIDGLMVI